MFNDFGPVFDPLLGPIVLCFCVHNPHFFGPLLGAIFGLDFKRQRRPTWRLGSGSQGSGLGLGEGCPGRWSQDLGSLEYTQDNKGGISVYIYICLRNMRSGIFNSKYTQPYAILC